MSMDSRYEIFELTQRLHHLIPQRFRELEEFLRELRSTERALQAMDDVLLMRRLSADGRADKLAIQLLELEAGIAHMQDSWTTLASVAPEIAVVAPSLASTIQDGMDMLASTRGSFARIAEVVAEARRPKFAFARRLEALAFCMDRQTRCEVFDI